jgi:hypothetical protein
MRANAVTDCQLASMLLSSSASLLSGSNMQGNTRLYMIYASDSVESSCLE